MPDGLCRKVPSSSTSQVIDTDWSPSTSSMSSGMASLRCDACPALGEHSAARAVRHCAV
eukprot:CAMPEP_0171095110 /NCGR_PEP_ID=MMETSP0766_2-20121228/42991_1 /TAXON_ID=439317 /ORGANISM="Gambierdiscus australes, Strain CAWD 149" /LENGTH=58 /DNA_ID=CAMNT_0011553885 /DNA_START=960 /DNA_END=1136 /DNA_ORIENTATION=-